MARRKDHTREELTELAIEAGRELVIKKGPTALTARSVAAEMGYTAGTLYNIFANIDALASAINLRSMDKFALTLEESAKLIADTPNRLRGISEAYLNFHRQEPHLWALLFAVPINHQSEALHQAIHRIFSNVIDAMLPISTDSDNARRRAKVLWSTLHGICLLQQSDKLNVGEEDSAEVLVEELLDQLLKS